MNTIIPVNAPVRQDSQALIDDLADAGPIYLNLKDWSIPVYYVDSETVPHVPVTNSRPGIYGAGFSEVTHVPIPVGTYASAPDGGDNHLVLIDKVKGLEWGLWWARKDAEGVWSTGLGAITDLNSDGVAPPWLNCDRELDCHRARASGFPLIAGLIRPEEIAAGAIRHALVLAYPHTRTEYFIPPASTAQAQFQLTRNDYEGLPMGAHIRLKPNVDIANLNLSVPAQIIATALQTYGAFIGDYAGGNVLYLDNSPQALQAWDGVIDNEALENVFTPEFIATNFEVLDTGEWLEGQNMGKSK